MKEKRFLIGAATAAHQVEGNNTNNDTWVLEQLPHGGYPVSRVLLQTIMKLIAMIFANCMMQAAMLIVFLWNGQGSNRKKESMIIQRLNITVM